ncbi:MAG: lactonase family protein [Pirellulaceae bacterium]|nr:lactonase family protein [Pirellulaceae bacterium]MDP7014962.1 lactonase family protein [Pirellulaceae bacterium]
MLRHASAAGLFLLGALPSLFPLAANARTIAYVSLLHENRVCVLQFDERTAQLREIGELRTPGEPAGLAVSADGRFMFISIRSTGRLASARIDPETGLLSLRSVVPAAADPAYLLPDPTGQRLLAAYYVGAKISSHRILPDGVLTEGGVQWLPTAEKAHAIALDPTGKFAIVPHTGPNAIYQFRVRDGQLTPSERPIVKTPDNSGPRHVWFHPRLPVVYAVNEQGSSVTRFDWRPRQGGLKATQTVSTLPRGFTGRNACADLEMTRDGEHLYASNRGDDSIAIFAVDPDDGRLSREAITATEETPRQFSLTPNDQWLIAAGQGSGKLAVFRVDEDSGRLERRATHPVGKTPWWIVTRESPPSGQEAN